jgi:hypothetical protein
MMGRLGHRGQLGSGRRVEIFDADVENGRLNRMEFLSSTGSQELPMIRNDHGMPDPRPRIGFYR